MTDKFDKNSGSDDINEFFSDFDDKVEASKQASTAKPSGDSANIRAKRSAASTSNGRTRTNYNSKKDNKQTNAEKKSNVVLSGKVPRQKKKKKKSKVRKFFKYVGLLVLLFVVGMGIYVGVIISEAASADVKIDPENIYSELSQRSTIYDDKGQKIENVFAEGGNRVNVAYDDLPKNLVNGIVAIEDKTFWDHHGFNFVRMAGAVKSSIFGGGQISGTSTITQQLARNIYLSNRKSQRSLSRKISEAYYTVIIERNLTKEQILEAYLNTIYLGFDSYGVEAASRAYFNKSVKDLDLLECAALCALPKSPDAYSLVKSYNTGSISVDKSDILAESDTMLYVYNGDFENSKLRRELTLQSMVDQKYLPQAEADKALSQDLRSKMKVTAAQGSGFSSYFNDFAIEQITKDIMDEYGWDRAKARDMIYRRGLHIYTTMNRDMQRTVEKAFQKDYGYPSVVNLRRDDDGNILNPKNRKQIVLYNYDNYFNSKDTFTLKASEFNVNSDGSLTIYKNKRLNIYSVEVNGAADVNIQFKPMYTREDGKLYTIENGVLSIPQGYKTRDAEGNCIVSAEFLKDYPNFFQKSGSGLAVTKDNYVIKQKVVQPQSAMVIMDAKTGGVKAMAGGRNTKGKMLFNRAMKPRQPGSSIKPIAIYSSGIQAGFEAAENGEGMGLDNSGGNNWGSYITAGSVINDARLVYNGRAWPKNWYSGHRGRMTLRKSVEQSVNVNAVKTYQQLGPEFPTSQLKKMGVTTIVEDGKVNDMNPAALALGGMTKGISPLQMAGAYTIFPNRGTYTEPNAYTKITNNKGEVLFDKSKTRKTEQVLDPGVAFIMTDVLRTTVTQGLATPASIGSQPVAGKTGTTSDNYDAWFVGVTPKYSAALWIGNDVNIELSVGSTAASQLWGRIMSDICRGSSWEEFPERPSNVSRVGGEYYVDGTYSYVPRPGNGESSSSESSEDQSTDFPTTRQTIPIVTTIPTTIPTTEPPTPPTTSTGTP